MVTRENISNSNVDILITNPESLDFLMISPNDERKRVIGLYSSQYPLKYIVFDEIHTWTGLSGAAIKLFIKRLRNFFRKSNPQLILLSATLKNPENLIKTLTESENYTSISFEPISVKGNSDFDFNRLKFCDFRNLIFYLCSLQHRNENILKREGSTVKKSISV